MIKREAICFRALLRRYLAYCSNCYEVHDARESSTRGENKKNERRIKRRLLLNTANDGATIIFSGPGLSAVSSGNAISRIYTFSYGNDSAPLNGGVKSSDFRVPLYESERALIR